MYSSILDRTITVQIDKWSDGKIAKATTETMRMLDNSFCNIPQPEGDTTVSTTLGFNDNK